MEKNNKTIAKNTIYLSVQQIIVLFVGLYTSRVILNVLGVEDFGIYNVVCGFVAMFAFLNTSMTNGIQRFYNYEYGKNGEAGAHKVFNVSIYIQAVLCLLILLLTETLGLWYVLEKMVIPETRASAAVWIYQFSIGSLLLLVLQIPYNAAILAHEKMLFFSVLRILDAVLKLVVCFLIQYSAIDKLIYYGFLMLLISLTNWIISYAYVRRNIKEAVFRFVFEKDLFKNMLSFSGWNLFGSFSGVAKSQGINLVLNLFFGPVVNAARGVAYQVLSAIRGFTSTISVSGRPQLMQSYAQGDIQRTFTLMFSLSKVSYMALFFVALPVMLEIDYLLNIWLGDTVPEQAGLFVVVVIMTGLVDVFNPPTSFVVHATGKMAKYQTVNGLVSLFVIPISYIVLSMGAPAVSALLLSLIFTLFGLFISLFILRSILYFSIRQYVKEVFVPLALITTISSVSTYYVQSLFNEGFLRLVIVTLFSCVIAGSCIYIFGLNSSEKLMVKKLLKNIR